MAKSDCKTKTDYARILTYSEDGEWQEWEPCIPPVVNPEPPPPPLPDPTFYFTLEDDSGQWETEAGDRWVQESAP